MNPRAVRERRDVREKTETWSTVLEVALWEKETEMLDAG